MLWGVTLRSPHPYARILGSTSPRRSRPPGSSRCSPTTTCPATKYFGLEHQDQPVLAIDVVRYQGEPVALVAADHPETARQAAKKIVVDYDVLEPVVDAATALLPGQPAAAPAAATWSATSRSAPATRTRPPTSSSPATTRSACRTRRSSGPSPGSPSPTAPAASTSTSRPSGCTSTSARSARPSASAPDRVRLQLAGVGGAFGGREDLSMHVHGCLLALHTGKPVKMVYNREESFFGHVHRHPASMHYEYGADRDGRLVYARATVHLDGGAYASSTPAVVGNAGTMGLGPYEIPNIHMDCYGAYTNNPPCGAMRGFGSVQTAFAVEAIMDKLADAVGLDPVEIRVRNGFHEGSTRADRPGDRQRRPGRRAGPAAAGDAAAGRPDRDRRRRLDLRRMPGGVVEHHPRRGRTPRRRLRGRLQERRVLRGLRRLLDRPGPARGRRPASRSRPCTPRPPRSARAWSPSSSRSAAPSSASSGWWSPPRTPRSGPPGRARRRGRPTSPAARSRPPARACGGWCSPAPAIRLGVDDDRAPAGGRRGRRPRGGVGDHAGRPARRRRRSRTPSSGGTGRRTPSTRRPGRASRTCSTPSRRTARSSTSTSSSGWSRWSSSPAPRTSARRSTRRRSSARSRAAAPRAWAWR